MECFRLFGNVKIHTSYNIKMYFMCDEHINISVLVSLIMGCIYLIVLMVVNDFLKYCVNLF